MLPGLGDGIKNVVALLPMLAGLFGISLLFRHFGERQVAEIKIALPVGVLRNAGGMERMTGGEGFSDEL